MRITQFQLLDLRVTGIGPFQQGRSEHVEFTDAEGEPCNMLVLASRNGMGKTTLLEAVAYLIQLVDSKASVDALRPPWQLDKDSGHMLQLDIRVETEDDSGRVSAVVLSLFDGAGALPLYVTLSPEQFAKAKAERQVLLGVARSESGARLLAPDEDEWLRTLRASFMGAAHRTVEGPVSPHQEDAPTLLYFTAYRNLARIRDDDDRTISRPEEWTHRVIRKFEHEQRWAGSLDKLFLWLYWLDGEGGRFQRACSIANEHVFSADTKRLLSAPRKDPPEMIVVADGQHHRLDQLSSGEKNILQLFVRIAAFATAHTVVLIDEVDIHLHPRWERWIVGALKALVASTPGMILIMSTHSADVLSEFRLELEEIDLRKTAHVIEEGFN